MAKSVIRTTDSDRALMKMYMNGNFFRSQYGRKKFLNTTFQYYTFQ